MKSILAAICFCIISITSFGQSIPKMKITDVEKYISTDSSNILVINFWATFCKPCVAEIPSFISTVQKYKNDKVKLLLVSLDLPNYYPAKIATFAKQHNFSTNIAWLNETNADYFCPKVDEKWSGAIPATLIVNTKTGYRKFFEDEMSAATFEKELKLAIIGKQRSSSDHSIDSNEPE
ncbi:MAG: TlpA disulfide reductase family protein [Ferruginibacter sp.]